MLLLRSALTTDSRAIYDINNHATTRARSISKDPISYDKHCHWFQQALDSPTRKIYLVDQDGRPSAVVRFDLKASEATISVAVHPNCRGAGVGRWAISEGCRSLFQAFPAVESIAAKIFADNNPSLVAFLKCGFAFQRLEETDTVPLLEFRLTQGAYAD